MTEASPNTRLEAFCDGVFAIALTLLIIDIKLPPTPPVESARDLWLALRDLAPAIFAFLLSFGIILITWVNHHGAVALVSTSSIPFFYANGLLLLSVVLFPFPTALLGHFIFTDSAAPAVVLYNAVLVVQSIGWMAVSGTALSNRLVTDPKSVAIMREARQKSFGAFALYGLLAIAAFWFPQAVAAVTTLSWVFWLFLGIRIRHH